MPRKTSWPARLGSVAAAAAHSCPKRLRDLAAQTDSDPSFAAGDHILLVKHTDSEHNWLSGKLNGVGGNHAQP
ncbi:hypothetical protein PtB15_13B319 [Puccinia triticina]|nr:hypothetical protein PtB15_13B319 [Puccinia triticina]